MSDAIRTGSVIDGFTVGEQLHAGGTAWLFDVTHPEHALPLLMKVPRVGPNQPTEGLVSFEVESMIMPTLDGALVPRFIAAGPMERVPYLVMERVEGVKLEDMLRPGGLDPAEVAYIGYTVALAAHSLHRQDAIHHDIKPDNIIIKPTREAILLDLGFAFHAHYPDLFREQNRRAVGSWPYMAPEAIEGVRADARSDQFAIGATLYELSTGECPFGIPETLREVKNRAWTEPRPPRSFNADFPPWLQEIILKCLEPNPAQRYGSCAQLAHALSHPESVELTERASRTRSGGLFKQLGRSLFNLNKDSGPRLVPSARIEQSPVVMVALDTSSEDHALAQAMADSAQRALARAPDCRLTVVAVIRGSDEESMRDSESARAREHLVRLRHWAGRFRLPDNRLSLHVFEASDPVRRIVDYAIRNAVDVIIIGTTRDTRNTGRTIMTRIVEEAPCSVHVVRAMRHRG